MKSTKIISLVNIPKRICQPLTFPLTEETLQEIEALKLAFRNSFVEHQVYSLGLSAPQIGVWKRFCIMPQSFVYGQITDFRKLKHRVRQFHVYINPHIIAASKEMAEMNQYCLSIGDNEYKIKRPKHVELEYYKLSGAVQQEKLDSLRSRVIQHQLDHFDGILMSEIPGAKIVVPNR